MKHHLNALLTRALASLQAKGLIAQGLNLSWTMERTRDPRHGDFACNIAMLLAKTVGMKPRGLAESLLKEFPIHDELIAKMEIAGPGFINIFLTPEAYQHMLDQILDEKEAYGQSQWGAGRSILIEFVSANPTGPLHVGHGRGAAYGAALANLLTVAGYQVHREYYVNDAGRQMDILATSIWLRYLELCGESFTFPSNGYQGDYVWDIAAHVHRQHVRALHCPVEEVFAHLPPDAPAGGDKEVHIDALIERTKHLLGETYQEVFQAGLQVILEDIRRDLEQFGVIYDHWFSEAHLAPKIPQAIEQLTRKGHTYEKEGALWFRSSDFGDEKDRVLIRENGQLTYFASDIAYHLNKLERGFDQLINIWGADHHGYIPRVQAVLSAFGADAHRLTVLLVQFATLYRGQERLQMSTRSGEFVTLRELREEVGRDAARFFYVQRRSEQHLNFDLNLAKSQSVDNPVYYIQYAHARCVSVFRRLAETSWIWSHHLATFKQLTTSQEQTLLITLSRYPEVIESAAAAYEPHQLTYYLRELAQHFHNFYEVHKILIEDEVLRDARLSLVAATRQVLYNGLTLLGVSAPEVM